MTKKIKPIKTRDWHAVNAHFRRSGPMKDCRKAADKFSCRDFTLDSDDDVDAIWEEFPTSSLSQSFNSGIDLSEEETSKLIKAEDEMLEIYKMMRPYWDPEENE